jgi:hypothetical protein
MALHLARHALHELVAGLPLLQQPYTEGTAFQVQRRLHAALYAVLALRDKQHNSRSRAYSQILSQLLEHLNQYLQWLLPGIPQLTKGPEPCPTASSSQGRGMTSSSIQASQAVTGSRTNSRGITSASSRRGAGKLTWAEMSRLPVYHEHGGIAACLDQIFCVAQCAGAAGVEAMTGCQPHLEQADTGEQASTA